MGSLYGIIGKRANGYDTADDFWHLGLNTLKQTVKTADRVAGGADYPHCSEAWDAISRYIYTGLQGGAIMRGWMNDERIMIACCSDGTRPVIFKIERMDYKAVYWMVSECLCLCRRPIMG